MVSVEVVVVVVVLVVLVSDGNGGDGTVYKFVKDSLLPKRDNLRAMRKGLRTE